MELDSSDTGRGRGGMSGWRLFKIQTAEESSLSLGQVLRRYSLIICSFVWEVCLFLDLKFCDFINSVFENYMA